MAASLNPYQSPRVLDAQLAERRRSAFAPYTVERLLVGTPLWFGVLLACGVSLGGVVEKLCDLEVLGHFEPPYWDEAAWTATLVLCLFALNPLIAISMFHRPHIARTRVERWTATIGVWACCLPLVLYMLTVEQPFYQYLRHKAPIQVLAWMIGLGLASGAIQALLWWNRRRLLMGIFRAFQTYSVYANRIEQAITSGLRPARP